VFSLALSAVCEAEKPMLPSSPHLSSLKIDEAIVSQAKRSKRDFIMHFKALITKHLTVR